MQDWVEKYRPKSLKDIAGNNSALRELANWAVNWKTGDKPVLLYGKPGTGKTSAALALASDMHWEIIELNASDSRTKATIDRIAGSAATTMSLYGSSRKLIVFDEADNLHGNADRGGARAILDIINSTRQPIILIANDIYGVPKELKNACIPIQFRSLQARSILPRLQFICSSEGIKCDIGSLETISGEASGDMRSAVNMLQAASGGEDVGGGDVATSSKDERSTIFDLVAAVFKGSDDKRLMRLSFENPDTPETTEQWIEDNLSGLKNPADVALAYEYVSKADEFLGLTYRRQYYTLWRYAGALMLMGTSIAADGAGLSGRLSSPDRWGKMYRAKRKKNLRNNIFRHFSVKYNIPEDTLRDDMLIPLSLIADKYTYEFAAENDLDKDELDFFLHDMKRSSEVAGEINKARKEREKAERRKKVSQKPVKPENPPAGKPPEKSPERSLFSPGTAEPAKPANAEPLNKADASAVDAEEKKDVSQSTLFDGF